MEPTPTHIAPGTFDLKTFLLRYGLRYWYIYLLCILTGLFIVFLILRYQSPTYRVEAGLLVKGEKAGRELDEELILEDLGLGRRSTNLENEIQVLKSRTLMLQVIDELGLDVSYFWEGRVRHTEIYEETPILADSFRLLPEAYEFTFRIRALDQERLLFGLEDESKEYPFGKWFETDYGQFLFHYIPNDIPFGKPMLIRFHPRIPHARDLSRRLQVNPVSESNMLRISLEDPVPERGEALINHLMAAYNTATVAEKNKVGLSTLRFIDERLEYLAGDLTTVEKDVEQYKRSNEIAGSLNDGVSLWLDELTNAEQEIMRLSVEQNILQSLGVYLQDSSYRYRLLPARLEAEGSLLSGSIERYNELLLRREELLKSGTERSPAVRVLDRQLEELRRNVAKNLELSLQGREARLRELRQETDRLRSRLQQLPRQERELTEILRQQGIKENLYLYLLQKREETALSLAITEPNARVIDPAQAGPPISLNPISLLALAVFGGLMLAVILITLRELLDDKVRSEEDIRAGTSIPLLGAVARNKGKTPVAITAGSRTPQAEMFRLLRTNLQFFTSGANCPTTLITSTTSGEGKTFTAVNLGIALALSGKRTVVMGLDLRKPRLEEYLQIGEEKPGITNYLLGEMAPGDIIFPTPVAELLSYVPSGPIPPNPAEILLSPRLRALFEHLAREYDHILVDSSPIGLVADALLLAPHVTNTLFVVQYNYTRKGMLQLLEELHREEKLPRPSIVFNGVRFGKGYGYGYGYGYG